MNQEKRIAAFLRFYTELPETPKRPRPADKRLAAKLVKQHTDSEIFEGALLLASARRLTRSQDLTPLQPIRSLHYFSNTIEEVQSQNLDLDYLDYLRRKIQQPDKS